MCNWESKATHGFLLSITSASAQSSCVLAFQQFNVHLFLYLDLDDTNGDTMQSVKTGEIACTFYYLSFFLLFAIFKNLYFYATNNYTGT